MNITFRTLSSADYPLFASWLGQPHVAKWWREPPTVEFVAQNYNGDGGKTKLFVAQADGHDIGVIQSFWRADYPEDGRDRFMPGCVGIDYLIGDPAYVGQGYGTAMIKAFIPVVQHDFPRASGILTDPEVANPASIRILEKAGFTKVKIVDGEHGPEQIMELPF